MLKITLYQYQCVNYADKVGIDRFHFTENLSQEGENLLEFGLRPWRKTKPMKKSNSKQ